MKDELLKIDYLMADETSVPVQIKMSKKKIKKGWFWVYYDPVRKITIFDYRGSRKKESVNEFLENYSSGILHSDGYAGYNDIVKKDKISHASCMAHVRRKFEKALDFNRKKASYAMETFKRWFKVDAEAREKELSLVLT